jgi:hypothetical protein
MNKTGRSAFPDSGCLATVQRYVELVTAVEKGK